VANLSFLTILIAEFSWFTPI